MYLESLIRLAEVMDHFRKNDEILISEEFHKGTEELIAEQVKFLASDLEFRANNTGPYDFGIGDVTLTIYSPDETGIQEWAMIARKGDWQRNYKFNSVIGLVKALAVSIKDINEEQSSNES